MIKKQATKKYIIILINIIVLGLITSLVIDVKTLNENNKELKSKYDDLKVKNFVLEQKSEYYLFELNKLRSLVNNSYRKPKYCDIEDVVIFNALPTGSMKPFIYEGLFTAEPINNLNKDSLNVGDVVSYPNPLCEKEEECNDIVHSIRGINYGKGVVFTKGYNNAYLDPYEVNISDITHRYCTLLPKNIEAYNYG